MRKLLGNEHTGSLALERPAATLTLMYRPFLCYSWFNGSVDEARLPRTWY